jgi:hypothetical protein
MLELKKYMSTLNIPKNEILKDALVEIVMKENLQKEYSAETKIIHEVMPHLFQNAMLMSVCVLCFICGGGVVLMS